MSRSSVDVVRDAVPVRCALFGQLADLRRMCLLAPVGAPAAEDREHVVSGGRAEAGSGQDAEHEAEREIDEREVVGERVRQLPFALLDQLEHLCNMLMQYIRMDRTIVEQYSEQRNSFMNKFRGSCVTERVKEDVPVHIALIGSTRNRHLIRGSL